MVEEAKKYKGKDNDFLHSLLVSDGSQDTYFVPFPLLAQDEATDARNASKNSFESYIYNLQHSLSKLNGAVNKAIEWNDVSREASKEGYEQKQTEIEAIVKYVCFPFDFNV